MVADKQLVEYIKKSVLAGNSLQDVREAMIGAGWPQKEVDLAVSEAKGVGSTHASTGETMKLPVDPKLLIAVAAVS